MKPQSPVTQSQLGLAMSALDIATTDLAVLCQNHEKALKDAQQKVTMAKGRLSALISILATSEVLA